MMELISVIITTYKRPIEILERALRSVINQSYKSTEIIIVDDNPESSNLINSIKEITKLLEYEKIRYVKHSINLGACAARNTGIKLAKGNYIAFLDDDDEWLPLKLEQQYKKIQESDAALVYCKYYKMYEEDNRRIKSKNKCYSGMIFDELILRNFVGSTSFVLIKKECFVECGGFDEKMKASQDLEMWLRVSKKFKVDYVDEYLVLYHIHQNERITSNPHNKIQGIERINYLYKAYLEKNKKKKSKRLFLLVPFYLIAGNKVMARRTYIEALRSYPYDLILNLKYLIKYLRGY